MKLPLPFQKAIFKSARHISGKPAGAKLVGDTMPLTGIDKTKEVIDVG